MLKSLALASTIAVYLLLLLGSMVSSTGSGLGCGPDWPLCRGQLIPSFSDAAVFIEWFHRLIAGLVGLLVLATAIVAWRQSSDVPSSSIWAGVAVLLLLGQVILGGVTVRLELPQQVSTAHLAVGTALFAVLLIMATIAFQSGRQLPQLPVAKNPQALLWLTVAVTFVQMVLGAYVRHSGAGLACLDPVICIPSGHPLVWVQFLHRVMALVILALVHAAGGQTLRATSEPAVRRAALTAMILVLVQIGLGVLSVATLLSTHATTAHLAAALALLGSLVFMATRATLSRRVSASAAQEAAR